MHFRIFDAIKGLERLDPPSSEHPGTVRYRLRCLLEDILVHAQKH